MHLKLRFVFGVNEVLCFFPHLNILFSSLRWFLNPQLINWVKGFELRANHIEADLHFSVTMKSEAISAIRVQYSIKITVE